MKSKPDEPKSNVERIQQDISNTIENYHHAEEVINKTGDSNMKKELTEQNQRREDALNAKREQIKEEITGK